MQVVWHEAVSNELISVEFGRILEGTYDQFIDRRSGKEVLFLASSDCYVISDPRRGVIEVFEPD